MGKSSGKLGAVAVAAGALAEVKSGNKRCYKRDAGEETEKKLMLEKKKKVAGTRFGLRKHFVPCDSSSKDLENQNPLVPCSQRPNIGSAASSKEVEEESREEPTTPSAPQVQNTGGSKTVVAKNLPFSATKSDVIDFFEQAGEIVDVRLSLFENGDFRGNCHIEFATEEGANKAVDELNGECFMGRRARLGFARDTIFIRGFDPSLKHDEVRSSLEGLFSTCGEIIWMHVPTLLYSNVPRGVQSEVGAVSLWRAYGKYLEQK